METTVREPTECIGYTPYEWPKEGGPSHLYKLCKWIVANAVQFLRYMEWMWAANVVGALCWEPLISVQAGSDLEKGKVDDFSDFGMNPKELSEDQKKQVPTLALHGKNGTQGTFLSMGRYFQENDLGPLFTLNLSEGELNQEDVAKVHAKIQEIQGLYGEKVKVNLLGYSRGAELALYAALPEETFSINAGQCNKLGEWEAWQDSIGKIIRIGSMTLQKEWEALSLAMQESIYEIRGEDDIHMPEKSLSKHPSTVPYGGHVGLPTNPKTHAILKGIYTDFKK